MMKNKKIFSLCMMIFIILIYITAVNAQETQNNNTQTTIEQINNTTADIPTLATDDDIDKLSLKEPTTVSKQTETKNIKQKKSSSTDKQSTTTTTTKSAKESKDNITQQDDNGNIKVPTTNKQIKTDSVKVIKTESTKYNIQGNVTCVLNKTTGKYVGGEEDGYGVKDAKVTLYDAKGKLIATTKSDEKGNYIFSKLNPGKYKVKYEYGTYLAGDEEITITNETVLMNHVFIPDIVFITSSQGLEEGQYKKIQILKSLSDRILFLESYNLDSTYDTSAHWMLDYANFILVDMYSQGLGFGVDPNLIRDSPASKNHMIAYTFGMYNDAMLLSLGWGYLGNNPHSIENTYMGSYWQAEATKNETVTRINMQNMLDYIRFLLGETDINPTLVGNGPRMPGPQWGVYYPGYTRTVPSPDAELINKWIHIDPGYNADGAGSLNWMTNYYNHWIVEHQDPVELLQNFETWYNKNVNLKGPFVVIISYYETTAEVEALIKEFEKQGKPVFCLYQYATTTPSMTELLEIAATKGLKRGISAGSSLYGWSTSYSTMNTNTTVNSYLKTNITILNALSGISKKSYESEYGPQSEWTYQVTIPEFEGIIGPIPISYIDDNGKTVIISESVKKHVQLVKGWANLKEKKNSDKKITIMVYDYPPGKANIGASYLDVFTSTHDLLVQLALQGYDLGMDIKDIPTAEELTTMMIDAGNKGGWAQGFLEKYIKENNATITKNHQLISKSEFEVMFNQLPKNLQDQMIKSWNTGLGNGSMIYNNSSILIPGFYLGNVFITSQPARGWDSVADYHSDTLAPPQQYVAFYKYLYQYFQGVKGSSTDAIISMGTHGTLEWLPGRTLGLQSSDWTFQLTEVPIIYPYIVSNPGEGMTAKERSFAQVITHMTPVTTASTLYGEYSQLSDAISNYDNNKKIGDESNMAYYKELILNITSTNSSFPTANFLKMQENITQYKYARDMNDIMLMELSKSSILNLSESLNKSMYQYFNFTLHNLTFDEYLDKMYTYVTSQEAFEAWLQTLHEKLESLSGDTITYGVHTLGYVWNDTEMVQGIRTIASSRTEILQHIMELYYQIDGDYYKKVKSTSFLEQQKNIEATLENIVTRLVKDTSLAMVNTIAGEVNQKQGSPFYEDLLQIKGLIEGVRDNMEWNSILGALSGGYVQPGLSGDPALSDVIPTGRAMYSSDTSKMPSKAAWSTAVKTVDETLIKYMRDLGEDTYPELVAEVIWGTEVLRTEGVSIAQFLYLLGVKPVWDQSGKVTGIEVMPLDELTLTVDGTVYQRPRIDVFATIVTNNPQWIGLMYNATQLVSKLNESVDDNYVLKHLEKNNSTYRLFGLNGPKLEGTGVSDLLNNIASWQNSSDGVSYEAASVYESRISNAWTVDASGNIVVKPAEKAAFVYLLSHVDLVIQNLDSTWRYLDSDDYTDWFGGLLNAANVHGAVPNTMLLDIRNKNNVVTNTISQEVSKEVMGTITNPQWLQAMTSSIGGWNQLSQNFENLIKSIFTTQKYAEDENGKAIHQTNRGNNTGLISNELFTNVVKTVVYSDYLVADADYKSYAMQSMTGWAMTLAMNNYWKTNDNKLMKDLIQKYVDGANKYGVACCHHTCGNVNLHEWILKTGSQFGVKGLERYSQQYYSATKTGTVLGTGDSGNGAGSGSGGEGNGTGSNGGTQIGDSSFQGYGDNGVSGPNSQYQGSGSSSSGSSSSAAISQMTGQSGQSSGNDKPNSGNNTGNNTGNQTSNGTNGNSTGQNATNGTSNGNNNANGQANNNQGNATGNGDKTAGESPASDEAASAAESSSSQASAASAPAGTTSATATVLEVSASGGQKASSQAEISLGYLIAIVLLALIFLTGFLKRSPRDG